MLRSVPIAALLLLFAAPVALAAEPTQERPIVVGDQGVSRGALEDATKRYQGVLIDREISRQTAAGALIFRAVLRGEARRRDLQVRRPERDWLQPTVARAIAAGGGDSVAFVRRFRAFEKRWRTAARCSAYWNVVPACRGETSECVWTGAADLCGPHRPDPPAKPFWSLSIWPPSFGTDEERSYPLERALRRRLARIPALRGRMGEILNEGEISVFALDAGAAAIVAREAYRLAQSRCDGRVTRSCGRG
jgi:hypothetical protein